MGNDKGHVASVGSEQGKDEKDTCEPLRECRRCKKELPLSNFFKDKYRKDGYLLRCKDCHRDIRTAKKPSSYQKMLAIKERKNIVQDRYITEKKRRIYEKALRDLTVRTLNSVKREKTKIKRASKSRIKWLESSVAHLVKDESWNKSTSKLIHLEIIIRAIIGYRKLEMDGIVAFSELAFLVTGSQFEYFSRKDVEVRTGKMFYFLRDVKLLIEAGYLQKIESKPLYYITLDGRKRLDAILGHIYKQKGLGNRIVKSK